jgi:hypothetical protein
VGAVYPLLKSAGLCEDLVEMYVIDKDTRGGIFAASGSLHSQYTLYEPFLPFGHLPPYTYSNGVYQELQRECGPFSNEKYTVMELIGKDEPMKELAAMCWSKEKRDEDLHEGNNRDPSRGALDAGVCLAHLEKSSLYAGIQKAIDTRKVTGVRVVILGGATGGMGSSLIVLIANKLRTFFPGLRIDLVILGTYFAIPARQRQAGESNVDDIGTSSDSFYRVADQLEELADLAGNRGFDNDRNREWRVYYAASPDFDDICGAFEKNGAEKRKAHLVELCAALAAFHLETLEPGFYETALKWDKSKNDSLINWDEIPGGEAVKKSAHNFMKLISVMAAAVRHRVKHPQLDAFKSDPFLKLYGFKKEKSSLELLAGISDLLEQWLNNVRSYVTFWKEVQEHTHLGDTSGKILTGFFTQDDVNKLIAILEDKDIPLLNEMPFCPAPWSDYVSEYIKPDKREIASVSAAAGAAESLFKIMMRDIYKAVTRKED